MEIIYVLVPLGVILLSLAIWAFFWAVKNDQFEDLEGPAYSILFDDTNLKNTVSDNTISDNTSSDNTTSDNTTLDNAIDTHDTDANHSKTNKNDNSSNSTRRQEIAHKP